MDICLYEVEILGEEMTELVANIIEESIYAKYDVNWKEYLLIDFFINNRKKVQHSM